MIQKLLLKSKVKPLNGVFHKKFNVGFNSFVSPFLFLIIKDGETDHRSQTKTLFAATKGSDLKNHSLFLFPPGNSFFTSFRIDGSKF